ncbi:Veg family protein [Serpentinicella sp. ANB-PHB4]|uniref:Veg family protein n=1 Tax=Serpentinicella sp. ANB-PHB4 TaxID=3074076 RepID=UPI0028605B1A|nr:Veg family protein [Serpentinicella sp. ANB-PHB4]MDR5659138.1 Veg family protein [Serpentinicella sp. ANB-PHB4]
MADRNTLNEIRRSIEGYVGCPVTLKANKGRKRILVREGIIENAYPNIFIVKINGNFDSVRRVSYSYSDVLTETVQLTVNNDNGDIKVS